MTKPIDQATKDLIKKEAEEYGYDIPSAVQGYVRGATVWAEKLKQQENEVSLRESQQDVMAADMVKLMDQIEYQKKAEKKDYDRIKKLEFRLKQERNKVIDECIEILLDDLEDTSNTREEMREYSSTVKRMESIKDKDYVRKL